ncbi:MAG: hypothetical protein R3E95_22895 [Thiolinea sp.]
MLKEILKNPTALFWAIVLHILLAIVLVVGLTSSKTPQLPDDAVTAVELIGGGSTAGDPAQAIPDSPEIPPPLWKTQQQPPPANNRPSSRSNSASRLPNKSRPHSRLNSNRRKPSARPASRNA